MVVSGSRERPADHARPIVSQVSRDGLAGPQGMRNTVEPNQDQCRTGFSTRVIDMSAPPRVTAERRSGVIERNLDVQVRTAAAVRSRRATPDTIGDDIEPIRHGRPSHPVSRGRLSCNLQSDIDRVGRHSQPPMIRAVGRVGTTSRESLAPETVGA